MNLDLFLSRAYPTNTWIREKYINIYIRKSTHYINNTSILFLDIGSVEVNEKYRGRGIFTAFLCRFEKEAKKLKRGVYVESIVNHRLTNFLSNRGYKFVPGTEKNSPSMFFLFRAIDIDS